MNKNKNIIETPKLQTDASVRFEAGVMLPPNTFLNADCMDYLPKCPSGYFDLAIVDPPYGIGESNKFEGRYLPNEKWKNPVCNHKHKGWDASPPPPEYFEQLFRVSKNQIIFGGNYFVNFLRPSMGWIFWDKKMSGDFSDGELAYTSFNKALKRFDWLWSGFKQKVYEKRIHPTQKPVALYTWILKNYAAAGDLILDTHVGSASSLIACKELGFDYVGFEIDKEYYDKASERVRRAFRKYELNFEQNEAAT